MAPVREHADWYLLAVALSAGLLIPARSETAVSPAAYLAGAAGLVAVQARLRSEFSPTSALAASLLIFTATSLFWSMTHSSVSHEALAFGLVAALVMVTARVTSGRLLFWVLVAAAPLGLAVLAGASPGSQPRMELASPLFSASRGLLSLTPMVYVAVIGTLAYARRNPFSAVAATLVFGVWVAVATFMAGQGEGAARHGLTAALAVLAPGLAYLIERARARPMLAVAPLVVAALLWNYWLMVQFTIGTLPKDAPVSFAAMVRQQADVHTRGPYAYPFAFPANAWFAWREGVPASRYDLLAAEPRRQSIDLALDESADRFLLEGWDAPGPDSAGPVHWIGERRATIALPLQLPADRAVRVAVTARARLEEPAVDADLGLEVNGHEIGRFTVPAAAAAEAVVTVPAAAVGRIFRAGYNRLTLVSHGVHRADPSDPREPGPLAGRVGSRAWPVAVSRIRVAAEDAR